MRLAWSARHAANQIRPSTQALGRRARRFVTPEELFITLDGRSVTAAKDRFRIEVLSVRDEAGVRWIQLALKSPDTHRMLTVRAQPGDGPQHVILTLSSWLNDPAGTVDVVNVA
jgi:hypothetical protein